MDGRPTTDNPHSYTTPKQLLSESVRLSSPSQKWQHSIAEMESRLLGGQFILTYLTCFGTRLRVPCLLCGATYTTANKKHATGLTYHFLTELYGKYVLPFSSFVSCAICGLVGPNGQCCGSQCLSWNRYHLQQRVCCMIAITFSADYQHHHDS